MITSRIAFVVAMAAAMAFEPAALAQQPEEGSTAPEDQLLPPEEDPGSWREVAPENLLRLRVRAGTIIVELRPDIAPGHVEQIRQIVRNGHYDGLPFHRVIDDFMAQGGEVRAVYPQAQPYPQLAPEFTFRRVPAEQPLTVVGSTSGGDLLGYYDGMLIQSRPESMALMMADKAIDSWVIHCQGVTSMARADAPNSADTQFFLMRQPQIALDASYTVWGRVLVGLDIVRAIKAGPDATDGRMPPEAADRLIRAELLSDVDPSDRPMIYVQYTNGTAYKTTVEQLTFSNPVTACQAPSPAIYLKEPEIG